MMLLFWGGLFGTTSLRGHASANKPGFAEHLVRLGMTSSSINRGDHRAVRSEIGSAQRRLLLQSAMER